MAIDTQAKRSAAGHVKKPGKGVTPNATPDLVWRAAVGWNYGGNAFNPEPPTIADTLDPLTLGTETSLAAPALAAELGGRGSL